MSTHVSIRNNPVAAIAFRSLGIRLSNVTYCAQIRTNETAMKSCFTLQASIRSSYRR